MKKVLSIGFVFLLLLSLTGCEMNFFGSETKGKTLTCTKSETSEDGYKSDSKVVITHKDNKVLHVKSESVDAMDEEALSFAYGFSKSMVEMYNGISSLNISIEKIGNDKMKTVMEIDYQKLDLEALKKKIGEESGELLEKKDYALDELKKELDGYTCK